jgi:hypothetical protein
MNFKDSYCANILAFDEVITKDSYYDRGNNLIKARQEINELIKFLIKEKCFDDNIKECHLNEYLSICEKTNTNIDFDEKKIEDYFLVGWNSHRILIFYKKISYNNYNLGMINAGEGSELQGVFGDLCNGIIIFHNITKEILKKFFDRYEKFFVSNVNFETNDTYYRFYFILFNSLFNKDEVNFDHLDETTCTKLKINSQILGTCTFTNHIGYIIYILFRNNVDDYNNKYKEWYHKAKQLMQKKIYEEIIELDNIFPYISSFLYINKTIEGHQLEQININELDLKKNIKPKNVIHDIPEPITRKNIYDSTYSLIFWKLYDFNDIDFIKKIKENITSKELENIIFKLMVFDEKNDLYNRPYFLTLFEIYKLKKKNIYLPDDLLKKIWEKILGKIRSLADLDKNKLLNLLIIFTLFQNKNGFKPYYSNVREKMEKNKKIYLYYFLQFIPILNGYYKDIIKDIVNEILDNIIYFPDFGDDNHSEAYKYDEIGYIKPKNAKKDGFFYIMMDYENLGMDALRLINDNEDSEDYKDNGIYIFSEFLNIDITNLKEKKRSYLKFMDYGYYIDNSNPLEKYIYSREVDLESKLKNYKTNYSVINYIKLFKNKIECNLKQKFNITYYFLYFYLCELDNKLIEDSIKNSYEKRVNEFIYNNIENDILYPILKAYLIRNDIKITNEDFILKKGTYYFPNNEKKYFNFRTLNYKKVIVNYDAYCKGIVDFYLVEYDDLKIIFYKNDNTKKRLPLIYKIIQQGYNIYTVLNFTNLDPHVYGKLIDQNGIDNIRFVQIPGGGKDILMLTKNVGGVYLYYYIINENDAKFKTLMRTKILFSNFLHLISMNDKCYLLYYDVKDEGKKNYFYLQLYHYDLFFELDIDNDKIYCIINSIKYTVEFNNDELILNLGIIKLISNGKKKLLCFYNYSLINEDISYYENKEFCVISPKEELQKKDNKNIILDELDDNYQKYFYTIIDNFENKYILKTVEDALAILLNCLYYCSPWLFFITYKSLSEIIVNNKVNKHFIKLLLCNMTGPYASIINLLLLNIDLYTEKNFNIKSDYFPEIYSTISKDFNENLRKYNNYNLNYYKKILEKYEIYLNINATSNYKKNISITYYHDWAKKIYIDSNDSNNEYNNEYNNIYSCFDRKVENNSDGEKIVYYWWTQNVKFKDGKCPPMDEEEEQIQKEDDGWSDDEYNPFFDDNPMMKIDINIEEEVETKFIEKSINKKEIDSLKINFKEKKTTIKNFCDLIENNIPNLNKENLQNNICKATELFEYLIKENKTYLFPIQELIMGSGKSSIITPYICILIINYLIQNKLRDREIYIVMPEQLIKQSFETFLKNLFPLHDNIELLIYPNDRIYSFIYNSLIKIYLISDTDYKAMFLDKKKNINTENMYMIYDEVDQMANPLTCELNFPENKVNLKNINIILDITKQLYNNIFLNQQFWKEIQSYVKINNNNKHNYIISEIDQKCLTFINDFFDKKIIIDAQYHNLIDYFKKNILIFILTKQLNYDYGLPEKYVSQVDLNIKYKFKAIPYGGGDDPLIGSEFSDVILSYVLTYFCYKLKRQVFRKIDIKKMIDKLILKYNKKDEDAEKIIIFNILKNFFIDVDIITIDQLKENKIDYYNFLKNENNLINDKFYEKYTEEVLNYNNNYNQNCINISFNDLLLNKNVKNFISFTGTAYINPPVEEKFYYKNNQIINYSKINQYNNVEQAIENLILNKYKIINFIMNKDDNIIENIFNCLSKYSVLIDIGAVFINYTNDQFRIEFQKNMNNKKYLVYFDNETKIYNLLLNKFENKNVINKFSNDAFFYFSNRYITGVDAKDIMNPSAKGLVTITNHTILRDFSQGIFRMRNILDGDQTIDLIINKNMINDKNILKGGTICHNFTVSNLTRKNLYSNLKENQNLLEIQKNKFLLKQNIFGLVKTELKNFNLILFKDPSDDTKFSINDDKKRLYSINDDLTINDINILNFVNDDTSNFIKCLTKKYFSSEINIVSTAKNIVIQEEKVEGKDKKTEEEEERDREKEKEEERQREREREKEKSKLIFQDGQKTVNLIVKPYLDYIYNLGIPEIEINTDGIIFLNDKLEFIIYNHKNNIICILNRIQLDLFIGHNTYSNIINNYTLICYQNDQYNLYWKNINEEELIKIIIIVKKILFFIQDDISLLPVFSKKEKIYMKNNNIIEIIKCKYKNIISKYKLIKIKDLESNFQKKYLKYKQKYLRIKNI